MITPLYSSCKNTWHYLLSVVDPDPDTDQDPIGSDPDSDTDPEKITLKK